MYQALSQGTDKMRTALVLKGMLWKWRGPPVTRLCGYGTSPPWNSVSPICKSLGPNDLLRSFQQKYFKILPLDPAPPGQKQYK